MSGGYNANDEIRAFNATTLTASYVYSSAYEYRSAAGLTMLIKYAADAGSATAFADVIVQVSADGTNWVDYGGLSGTGTITFTPNVFKVTQATNGPTATVIIDELRGRWVRFGIKEESVTAAFFGAITVYVYPHCK